MGVFYILVSAPNAITLNLFTIEYFANDFFKFVLKISTSLIRSLCFIYSEEDNF